MKKVDFIKYCKKIVMKYNKIINLVQIQIRIRRTRGQLKLAKIQVNLNLRVRKVC